MGFFYIVLIDHRVLERGVDALVTEELLYLFDRHSLINGHRRQGSPELVRMDLVKAQLPSDFSKPNFNPADLQSLVWAQQRNE